MKYLIKRLFIIFLILNYSIIHCSFQLSLFSKLNEKHKKENFTISPLSIFQALSLALNGAKGTTKEEMLKALSISSLEELNEINKEIFDAVKEMTTIEMANAILVKFNPLEKFAQLAKSNYPVEIKPLKSLTQINEWCNIKTHGKISKILDVLPPKALMIILNAIYFKGKWVNEFNKDDTNKLPFYSFGNKQNFIKVDTMIQTNDFSYYEDSKLQSIKLPYRDDSMSAIIILPNENTDINEFIHLLDKKPKYLSSIISNMEYKKVRIELPKVEMHFTDSLKESLTSLGMKSAFTKSADFSEIRTQNDLYIDDVLHKTYLKVDEMGTEAAAVTAMIMVMMAAPQTKKIKIYEMKVNRPFLFIIMNQKLKANYDFIFISKIEEIN